MSFDELVAAADRIAMAVFGEPELVTYAPQVGDALEVTGIFDLQYVLAKGSAEAGVEALGPAVFLRLEDLPEDPTDESTEPTLTIRGVVYIVTERRPDGLGGIVLELRKQT
jgi:hypothetical protein